MTPQQATDIFAFLQPQLVGETRTTRKVLAAVPDDRSSYKPHETCMSAIDLVRHIAMTDAWFLESIVAGSFGKPDDSEYMAISKASDVVAHYEKTIPTLLDQVAKLSAEDLAKPIQFYTFNMPAVAYLQFMQKHTIHHRGQLSAYLRPMGAKVPSIYGGSADEPFTASAEA